MQEHLVHDDADACRRDPFPMRVEKVPKYPARANVSPDEKPKACGIRTNSGASRASPRTVLASSETLSIYNSSTAMGTSVVNECPSLFHLSLCVNPSLGD